MVTGRFVPLPFRPRSFRFVNTDVSSSRGTGLKTVYLSVCGNLRHIGQNLRFLKCFASLDERYDAKCRQN
jgi:hypothetical protein